MIKNYIKIAWRNIIRHKAFSIINIAGLAIGIAACLLIFLIVDFELSFDKFQPQYSKIYRVVNEQKRGDGISYSDGIPVPMSPALKADFPDALFATIYTSYGSQVTISENANTDATKKFVEPMGVLFAEANLFKMFKFNWLAGSADVLNNPGNVIIDKTTAGKYFGDWKNAIGKLIKLDNLITLKVSGIIDDAPANTDMPLKVIASYKNFKDNMAAYDIEDSWGNNSSSHQVFMLLNEGQTKNAVNKRLKIFGAKHYSQKKATAITHFLQPLAEMHFDSRFGNALGDHVTSKATIRTLSLIAMLIIAMASINFINLSTAQSVKRSKEVGIRKVLGSSRMQLVKQSIGETTLIVLFSVMMAIGIAFLALPYLKNIASVPDDMALFTSSSMIFLVVIAVVVIVISGLYPALVVSGFKPVLAIKNKITAASVGGVSLRRVLVVTQFAISQLLIIGTIVAVKQMGFINSADLGFNKSAVLVIPGSTDSISLKKSESFKQEMLQNPGVKAVTFMSDQPSSDNNWSTNFYYDNSTIDKDYQTSLKFADADYFKTFELHFKAGHPYTANDSIGNIVVNETFVHKLGLKSAEQIIGKTVRLGGGKWRTVVGVVEDFKTNSLRDAIRPIVLLQNKAQFGVVAVKINTANFKTTVSQVQSKWEKTYPEYAYKGYFLDENIADFYKQENQLALIYKIFAGIAIFISCLGLYGLISFIVVQRTKEVGVRKVLGASVSSIVLMFSKEFILLISISFLIATPAAYYMMNRWLQSFVFRIPLSAWIFILSVVMSLIVAWLTVGYKAVKAALANPVTSLRSE
ncbi:ABC transporter permease [Mucilaginibacter auburnensis]|uniref:Putative permease n=1 Tax=Mucilaginibacter auburnensis TaxID=1457233 RepID=A0A2H9VLP1_9SPHI|nr:ABC transporter permease [Mucilaginibacter auburnensis]PJJ79232.1 putative permease [Mucilaginibacter auburnensis]